MKNNKNQIEIRKYNIYIYLYMYKKMQLNTDFLLLFVQWAGSSRNILIRYFPFISVALDFLRHKTKPTNMWY